MTGEYATGLLPALYRKDPWVLAMFSAAGAQADTVAQIIQGLYDAMFFDTMPEHAVSRLEEIMGIVPATGQALADRRSVVQARWKSAGKISLSMIEEIAHSWEDGEIAAYFIGGRIRLVFESVVSDATLWHISDAVEAYKPAHIPLDMIRLGWLYSGEACAGEF